MYINGQWCEADQGARFPVTNPATGEILGEVPDGDASDAARTIDAAAEAFPAWAGQTAFARSAILHEAYRLMVARKEDLARGMTREQGKPLRAARVEVQYAADFLIWFAEEAKRVNGEVLPAPRGNQRFIVLRQPVGVVGAITPWNYPVSMLTRKIGPALAAYIYTNDISRAMHAFEALDFGIVGINDINPTAAAVPFGGIKESGLGREGGREGIMEYLDIKVGGFAI